MADKTPIGDTANLEDFDDIIDSLKEINGHTELVNKSLEYQKSLVIDIGVSMQKSVQSVAKIKSMGFESLATDMGKEINSSFIQVLQSASKLQAFSQSENASIKSVADTLIISSQRYADARSGILEALASGDTNKQAQSVRELTRASELYRDSVDMTKIFKANEAELEKMKGELISLKEAEITSHAKELAKYADQFNIMESAIAGLKDREMNVYDKIISGEGVLVKSEIDKMYAELENIGLNITNATDQLNASKIKQLKSAGIPVGEEVGIKEIEVSKAAAELEAMKDAIGSFAPDIAKIIEMVLASLPEMEKHFKLLSDKTKEITKGWQTTENIFGVTENDAKEMGKTIDSFIKNPIVIIATILKTLVLPALKMMSEYAKESGQSFTDSFSEANLGGIATSFRAIFTGASPKAMLEMRTALRETSGDISNMSQETISTATMVSNTLHVSKGTVADIVGMLGKSFDSTGAFATETMRQAINVGAAAGLTANQTMTGLKDSGDALNRSTRSGVGNLILMNAHATQMGIKMKEVYDLGRSSILDLEGSLEKEFEAQAMGVNVDLTKFRQLSFAGKGDEAQAELGKQMAGSGYENMNMIQQAQLESLTGMNPETLRKLAAGEQTAGSALTPQEDALQKNTTGIAGLTNAIESWAPQLWSSIKTLTLVIGGLGFTKAAMGAAGAGGLGSMLSAGAKGALTSIIGGSMVGLAVIAGVAAIGGAGYLIYKGVQAASAHAEATRRSTALATVRPGDYNEMMASRLGRTRAAADGANARRSDKDTELLGAVAQYTRGLHGETQALRTSMERGDIRAGDQYVDSTRVTRAHVAAQKRGSP